MNRLVYIFRPVLFNHETFFKFPNTSKALNEKRTGGDTYMPGYVRWLDEQIRHHMKRDDCIYLVSNI